MLEVRIRVSCLSLDLCPSAPFQAFFLSIDHVALLLPVHLFPHSVDVIPRGFYGTLVILSSSFVTGLSPKPCLTS